MNTALETGTLFTTEHAVNVAGFGKLIIEDGYEATAQAANAIKKAPALLTQEGKSTAQVIREVARNTKAVHPSTPVGRRGLKPAAKVQKRLRQATIINNREYSIHAIERMQERGFYPSIVESVIKNGITTPDKEIGKLLHFDATNNITAITNKATGKVISIF